MPSTFLFKRRVHFNSMIIARQCDNYSLQRPSKRTDRLDSSVLVLSLTNRHSTKAFL